MCRLSLFAAALFCLPSLAIAQTNETIIPAGTLLPCTLDEPRFSSETAQVGDPLLCHVSSLTMFGHSVFPRGAYLSGRLEGFRDPGHFVGKGSLTLEFETLTLPGGTFPLSAKVVSAPRYRIKADGTIRGRGHARRDAIEWAIPLLWPEKLVTLPMRGPRPELKGETRILLRVLEDVSIPTEAASGLNAKLSMQTSPRSTPSLDSASRPRMGESKISGASPDLPRQGSSNANSNAAIGNSPRVWYGGVSIPADDFELPLTRFVDVDNSAVTRVNPPVERPWRAPKPTLLFLKDGRAYLATKYWMDADRIAYVASDGTRQSQPLEKLDFETTARLNRERGVTFEIRSRQTEP